MDLLLPKGTYRRSAGNLPPFVLANMLAEATPSAKGGVSLQSFPGLASAATRGSGPIYGMYRKPDLFGGATFTISGANELYKDGALLGTIDGSGPVSWANTNTELVVARGASAWSYNGTNLAAVAFPDGANVTAVTALSERFIYVRASSYRFYWSDLLDGRTVDGANFASAESSSDWIRDALAIGDALYLGGKDSIEVWYPSGDSVLPFRRITQRTARVGVFDTGCMIDLDNALHFAGSDRVAYRMGEVPQRISHSGIEEALNASASCLCFPMTWNGHAVFYMRLDTETLGFDVSASEWHNRESDGLTNWRARCCVQQDDGTPLFGSATDANLFEHSGWDDAGADHVRTLTAALPTDGTVIVDEIEIEANTGTADVSVADPMVEMRFSKDRGNTWSDWIAKPLGNSGKTRVRPRWRRLGYADAPGLVLQFRCSAAVDFRVSGAIMDESAAGRTRAA